MSFPLRRPARALLALLVVAGASGLAVADDDATAAAQSAALLRLSGLEAQLDGMAPQVLQGFQSSADRLPEGLQRRVVELVQQEYGSATVRADILARLVERHDPERVEHALAWLRSAGGQRIRVAEEAASTPEAMAGMQSYARALALSGAPPERLPLMNRIEAGSETTDFVLDTVFSTSLAVAVSLDAASGGELPTDVLADRLEGERERMRPAIRETVLLSMLYTYRDVSEETLESYAAFLESDAGRWYSRTLSRAMLGAMTASATRLGTGLREAIEPAPASRQPL